MSVVNEFLTSALKNQLCFNEADITVFLSNPTEFYPEPAEHYFFIALVPR